ncbi:MULTISPECIES: hypothetical protein [unclassified Myroides]|nr:MULTISPECIES: hypothetical protein [unclassified Myroides]
MVIATAAVGVAMYQLGNPLGVFVVSLIAVAILVTAVYFSFGSVD